MPTPYVIYTEYSNTDLKFYTNPKSITNTLKTHWGLYLHTFTIVRKVSKSVKFINGTHSGPVLSLSCKYEIHEYSSPHANSEAAGETLQASCASFPAAATIKTPCMWTDEAYSLPLIIACI